jgi:cGMP-dependent protein kinase
MYEFSCGGVPYGENAEDPMDVYLTIINEYVELINFLIFSQLSFPGFVKDKEFKHLIASMLNKNPINRLLKFAQIKNHVWFKKFDWVRI